MRTQFRALLLLPAFALCGSPISHAAPPAAKPMRLLKSFKTGGAGGWDYLTFDSATRRVYITRGSVVQVVDADKGKLVGSITGLSGIHGVSLVPLHKRGFISEGGSNSVTIFDLKTLKTISKVSVGEKPDAILYDPATDQIFTFNAQSKDSTVLNAATGKVVGTIALGGKPEFAVSDEKGGVFVNIEDTSEIISIDAKALTVKNRWPLSPGEGPSGLAIDLKSRRLFAVCDNEKMVVMNADDGQIIATPEIGKGPDAAAFDPITHMAYSSNGEDGTLTVIKETDDDKFVVVDTIKTAPGARTMALDPKTHHVLLFAAQTVPPKPGEPETRRRPYVPGTFEVLIVGAK